MSEEDMSVKELIVAVKRLREALQGFTDCGGSVYPCLGAGYDKIDEDCQMCSCAADPDDPCPYRVARAVLDDTAYISKARLEKK